MLMGVVRMISWPSKSGIEKLRLPSRRIIVVDIVVVVVCTSRVVKMKEHLPFCKEFNTLCVEERVVVDQIV